jgi:hypothetical protein
MTDLTLNELRSHTFDKIVAVLEDESAKHKLVAIEEIHRDYKTRIDGCLVFERKKKDEDLLYMLPIWVGESRLSEREYAFAKYHAMQFNDPSAAYGKLRSKGETQGFENAMEACVFAELEKILKARN